MSGTLTVDDTLFRTRAKKLLAEIGMTEDQFLDEQAPLLFGDIARATPPHAGGRLNPMRKVYGSPGDKKAGENAIRSDLSIIFKRRERGYLETIHDITGTKRNIRQTLRTKQGTPYLIDVDVINYDSFSEAENWHKDLRRSDGRVKGKMRGGQDTKIGRWTARDRMWITPQIYNQLYQKLTRRVGQGKALFSYAAVYFGGRAAPKWVSRHFATHRPFVQRGEGFRTARASGGALVHVLRLLPGIERNRAAQAEKRLGYLARNAIKKSGFRTV